MLHSADELERAGASHLLAAFCYNNNLGQMAVLSTVVYAGKIMLTCICCAHSMLECLCLPGVCSSCLHAQMHDLVQLATVTCNL